MDAAAFEQVYGSFRDFHAYFAPLFGRRETREHSGHYLQALLVQSGERRNAENLSETVPGSARGMLQLDTPSDRLAVGQEVCDHGDLCGCYAEGYAAGLAEASAQHHRDHG